MMSGASGADNVGGGVWSSENYVFRMIADIQQR
jgi:hypothetical protein